MSDDRTTEMLRKLLDERGVEWWAEDDPEEPAYYFVTKWFANGCEQTYEEIPAIRSRSLKAYCVLPEQAIAATLGRGTCEPDEAGYCPYCGEDLVRCDVGIGAGGGAVELDPPIYYNYCPNCGRAVKQ